MKITRRQLRQHLIKLIKEQASITSFTMEDSDGNIRYPDWTVPESYTPHEYFAVYNPRLFSLFIEDLIAGTDSNATGFGQRFEGVLSPAAPFLDFNGLNFRELNIPGGNFPFADVVANGHAGSGADAVLYSVKMSSILNVETGDNEAGRLEQAIAEYFNQDSTGQAARAGNQSGHTVKWGYITGRVDASLTRLVAGLGLGIKVNIYRPTNSSPGVTLGHLDANLVQTSGQNDRIRTNAGADVNGSGWSFPTSDTSSGDRFIEKFLNNQSVATEYNIILFGVAESDLKQAAGQVNIDLDISNPTITSTQDILDFAMAEFPGTVSRVMRILRMSAGRSARRSPAALSQAFFDRGEYNMADSSFYPRGNRTGGVMARRSYRPGPDTSKFPGDPSSGVQYNIPSRRPGGDYAQESLQEIRTYCEEIIRAVELSASTDDIDVSGNMTKTLRMYTDKLIALTFSFSVSLVSFNQTQILHCLRRFREIAQEIEDLGGPLNESLFRSISNLYKKAKSAVKSGAKKVKSVIDTGSELLSALVGIIAALAKNIQSIINAKGTKGTLDFIKNIVTKIEDAIDVDKLPNNIQHDFGGSTKEVALEESKLYEKILKELLKNTK